jgi:hypothetical protein
MDNYSIDRELSEGETILWQGKPATGIKLRGNDIFLIPLSVVWGGFAIFWELSVMVLPQHDAPSSPVAIMPVFGLPFVLIGLYIMFGRFWVDARQRAKTIYAVTNERIIIVSGLFLRRVKSLNLKALPSISVTEKSDGSGTILLGETMFPFSLGAGGAWPGRGNTVPAFEMIDDVRRVEKLIRKAQRGTV